MTYITVRQSPKYKQMTLEEYLFGYENKSALITHNTTNTKTYEVESVSAKFSDEFDITNLVEKLIAFNSVYSDLRKEDRSKLYHTFHVPKKRGGLRRIDQPNDDLMNALRNLKTLFEDDFKALYHTNAFAYIKGRSTIDAVKRHQANESRWFAKYDLSNFFGSTTVDFVMKMLGCIYPFSAVIEHEALGVRIGEKELRKAIELAFLNGGLPQGTPISPLITNIIMIPFDFTMSKKLRETNDQKFVYTRYADDFIISSRSEFKFREIEKLIIKTLKEFDAPFTIKKEKTRYGSSAGKNWNLGVMLNKDNEITVGRQKKRQFQAMLTNFILDTKSGNCWNLDDIQTLEGYRNYYRMVEGDTIDKIVEHIGKKHNVNVVELIKAQLNN